jgi:hypothetical protein
MEWPATSFGEADFLLWSEENWPGIFLRKERKAVFRKPFFAECAASYLTFAQRAVQEDAWPDGHAPATAWFTGQVKYMGRYIAARWVEVMRRAFPTDCSTWAMLDPSTAGAEHPRKALALLHPEHSAALLGKDTKENIRISDSVMENVVLDLALEYGLDVDYYTIHSLLCEYKQAIVGKRQHPGKSLDSEVAYADKVAAYWRGGSDFYPIRESLFPGRSLGELNGWHGVRPGLEAMLHDHGIVWSDAVYDYTTTIEDPDADLAHPVLRNRNVESLLDLL